MALSAIQKRLLAHVGGSAAIGFGVGTVSDMLGATDYGKWNFAALGAGMGFTASSVDNLWRRGLYNSLRYRMGAAGGTWAGRRTAAAAAAAGMSEVIPFMRKANRIITGAAAGYGIGSALDATGLTDSMSGWGLTLGAGYGAARAFGVKSIEFNGGWSRFKSGFNKWAAPGKHAG